MAASDAAPFLAAVQRHADVVLRAARGHWSDAAPELFVDALDVETRQPPVWRHPADGRELVLSNFANQQDLLRTLVGLSALTGEPRYADAARRATLAAWAQLRDSSGLLHWGGHWAYDLRHGAPFGMDNFHELKTHYPFYEELWAAHPSATRTLIEAIWSRHILDWTNLDLNRHGEYGPGPAAVSPWLQSQKLSPVFFVGRGLSFKNTGSDLFYAAALLGQLTGEPGPRSWAHRLAERYVETRDPQSGLGGYQFSQIADDRAARQFGAELGDRAREHSILDRTRAHRTYGVISLCQLELGERLGSSGTAFVTWAADDLRAFARHAYDAAKNQFHAVLRDGTRLSPADVKRPGYYQPEMFAPYRADGVFLWAYAKAFRLTGDAGLGRTAGAIARGLGLDPVDAATPGGTAGSAISDPWMLHGLLELHRATGRPDLLQAAVSVGHRLLSDHLVADLFVSSPRHRYGRIGASEPLALLHLAAALRGEDPSSVPAQLPGKKYFTAHAWQKGRTSDYLEWFPQLRS